MTLPPDRLIRRPGGVSPTGRLPTEPEMQNLPGTLAAALEMLLARVGLKRRVRGKYDYPDTTTGRWRKEDK